MNSVIKLSVGAALLAGSVVGVPGFEGTILGASEAEAGRYYRHHRRDKFDVGDAIVGGLIVGGLIAVLSGSKKKKDREDEDREGNPRNTTWEPRGDWDEERSGDRDDDWRWADRDWSERSSDERRAIGVCAREAEFLGRRYEEDARVRLIRDVTRDGNEYRVGGLLDVRGYDRDERPRAREFFCYVDGGRITDFQFETAHARR